MTIEINIILEIENYFQKAGYKTRKNCFNEDITLVETKPFLDWLFLNKERICSFSLRDNLIVVLVHDSKYFEVVRSAFDYISSNHPEYRFVIG